MISLRAHNILDYVIAGVLVLCPFVFGFSDVLAARNVFVVLGLALATYSLITDYPISIAKIIPLGVHMAFDVTTGVIIMLAPALFGYRELISGGTYALHFIMGFGAIALVAMTTPRGTTPISSTVHDIEDFRRAG